MGVCLGWAGAAATGYVVVFAAEHGLFGLPALVATSLEVFLAWVPIGLAAGVVLKLLLGRKALAASLPTAAVSILALASLGPQVPGDLAQWMASLSRVLAIPGSLVLATVSLGTFLATAREAYVSEV